MIYKGYKITVRCINWEQIDTLDKYLALFTPYASKEKLIGLGMNWTKDYLYFDYAVGVINNEEILKKLKNIDFSNTQFKPEYIEINLPELKTWEKFKGKEKDLKDIYEQVVKCYERPYDYELEYIDGKGNIEIKIHYINN
ncbi:MAG: hypothetical protein NC483_02295 [Ruminococcus sp.]|nr:hypothetical protein [Ruminococcus sp.]